MPSGRPSGTLFSAQSLLWVSLPPSFALSGRVEAENWSPRGPKGVSEGLRKWLQIDSKSLSVSIGGLRRAGGYPPGACGTSQVHIYAYLCTFLCVFVHIHAYLCMFMHVFMRIHAYSCIFMHVYACTYAYSYILLHISGCLMHVSCICMHIHAYLCIFMYIYAYVWFRGNTYTLNITLCTIGLDLNCS